MNNKGDCFAAAGREMIHAEPETKIKLVHAMVQHPLPPKNSFLHGFNIIDDTVIDTSNDDYVMMDKDEYFETFNIKQIEGMYVEYDMWETLIKLARTGHFGPWDLKKEAYELALLFE